MDFDLLYPLFMLQQHSQFTAHTAFLMRMGALCGVFVLPFMLAHIYGHFAIPKGYEGVRNEDLGDWERENFDLNAYCMRKSKERLASHWEN
jgi:hypothetical protein